VRIIQFLHGNALGGMEKFCLDLSNTLAREHDVLLLADKGFGNYVSDQVRFVEIDVEKSRNNPLFLWDIYRIIKKFQPDIIHAHKQNSIQILKRLSFFLDIPYVATKHDMQHKKAFHGIEYAVAISDDTAKTIRAKHLYKIYNGIPLRQPSKIDMPDAFNIVAVGGLRKVKGYDTLLEAVSRLAFDWHLTILGEGDERPHLEATIRELGIGERVTLAGHKENIHDYLYSSDLQVISSHSEGFSLAMVEGIFYAPALITTKVGIAEEILPSFLLTDREVLSNKIEDVYHNYKAYRILLQEVKAKYREVFKIEQCAKEYLRVFQKIQEIHHV